MVNLEKAVLYLIKVDVCNPSFLCGHKLQRNDHENSVCNPTLQSGVVTLVSNRASALTKSYDDQMGNIFPNSND